MWPPGSRLPGRSRAPPRNWRSLLPELVRMVPWPRGRRVPQSEEQVLENVLGYIRYLRSSVSSARGGAGLPIGDPVHVGPSAGVTPSPPHQKLVPYEEEEEEEGTRGGPSPPLCAPQPYWEELGREEGVSLCPPPRQGALLASPPPPAPPGDVIRGGFGGGRGTQRAMGGGGAHGPAQLQPPQSCSQRPSSEPRRHRPMAAPSTPHGAQAKAVPPPPQRRSA
ncbi:trithorax group protein osa-like [Neopsephotus bourkii]|uniref:trithorax group protein osa-like n=1 Tax=Neopsephotus bourkii TaxID=309878 RepID=UPI002AA5BCE1|nr:trithorax group protein osa-like [Neopsephotus bourkii]